MGQGQPDLRRRLEHAQVITLDKDAARAIEEAIEAARDAHRQTPHYLAFKDAFPALQAKDRYSDLYTGVYIDSDKVR